jgi:hypothetical protein
MPFDLETFERSLAAEAPPEGLDRPLLAVWHGLKGAWSRAHAIVQEGEGDPACDWVHAWLHRIEGDLGNAAYWYRRAGRSPADGPTDREGRAIAAALLARGAGGVRD